MGRMSLTQELKSQAMDSVKGACPGASSRSADLAVPAGTIRRMHKDRSVAGSDAAQPPALPKDQSRHEMMAREKRMTLEQRVELFERLSRDAAWARSAKRVR